MQFEQLQRMSLASSLFLPSYLFWVDDITIEFLLYRGVPPDLNLLYNVELTDVELAGKKHQLKICAVSIISICADHHGKYLISTEKAHYHHEVS